MSNLGPAVDYNEWQKEKLELYPNPLFNDGSAPEKSILEAYDDLEEFCQSFSDFVGIGLGVGKYGFIHSVDEVSLARKADHIDLYVSNGEGHLCKVFRKDTTWYRWPVQVMIVGENSILF